MCGACNQTHPLYNFARNIFYRELALFFIYIFVFSFFFLLAKQALRKFPQRMSGQTFSSLELRLPGKVPSARISSFAVLAIKEKKV